MTTQTSRAKEQLKGKISGSVLVPHEPGYEEARQVWNGMIDRRPAVIVQCSGAGDVPAVIEFARRNHLDLSIRGGGHHIAGNALCDDGVTIDFSKMKRVRIDVAKRRAYVEPGATLADVDEATQAHGLAVSVGVNSTTGIAGLTLGGGFGWLTRKYGMTIDSLLGAELVTADGAKVRVSETENSDLFWAIRGGGGNFGVVTGFEFQLVPVGPEVFAGLIVFPFEQAPRILNQYRQFVKSAPEELNVWVVLRKAPPLPFLPETVHGKEVVVLPVFYSGKAAEAERLIAPLRDFGEVHGEHLGVQPYVAWQKAFDPLLAPGARNYWKTHNFTELSDGALGAMIEFAGRLPSPQCEIFIGLSDGAPNRVSPAATAYAHRDAKFVMNVHARWDEKRDDEKCIEWARGVFAGTAPFASAGAYVNFMTGEEGDRVAAAYGTNYARLKEIKKRYDPENVFHINQNIKP
jgi:FAD/FMN-containing dehydrogenase